MASRKQNPTLNNVHCDFSGGVRMSAHFDHAGARYHVWLDPDTLAFDGLASGGNPTLYKNPPLGTPRESDAYFDARKLDCSRGPSKVLVDELLRIIKADNLVQKARQVQAEEDRAVQAERAEMVADKRRRDGSQEMAWALQRVFAECSQSGPRLPLSDSAMHQVARALHLSGCANVEPPALGPIAVILDGGLCQGVVTSDQRLQGVTFAVVDYDSDGADDNEIVKVARLDCDEEEEEACLRTEEIGVAQIDIAATIKRSEERLGAPIGAQMPDGTFVAPWDERLRASGASPIYG